MKKTTLLQQQNLPFLLSFRKEALFLYVFLFHGRGATATPLFEIGFISLALDLNRKNGKFSVLLWRKPVYFRFTLQRYE